MNGFGYYNALRASLRLRIRLYLWLNSRVCRFASGLFRTRYLARSSGATQLLAAIVLACRRRVTSTATVGRPAGGARRSGVCRNETTSSKAAESGDTAHVGRPRLT